MNLFKITVLLSLLVISGCHSQQKNETRLLESEQQLHVLRSLSVKEKKNPRSMDKNGEIVWARQPYDWTEGFWPGTCWMLYEKTGDEQWKEAASTIQELYVHHKDLTNDHDLGFIFNNSFGKAFRITGDERYKKVLLDAADALITRFNPNVGCIQSWDVSDNWQSKRGWKFPVIIDNLMNLELLFEASEITGDPKYSDVAIAHANTTMAKHFRKDGSSYHVVDYDPGTGAVNSRITAQGYADESAWARGQAWGLYGYTMCYRYTKDRKYLEMAEKISGFILSHPNYPEDGVPFWDFNAPDIPDALRDASAGGIMASAWIELDGYSDRGYLDRARTILETLSSEKFRGTSKKDYFLLKHSVGSIPHGNEIDVPLNYADYYYLEALLRITKKAL
ncbi:glycoside hydrolase family 88 protein [Sinomicrobium soli]|uniref:glycoside hydrolase family 88 protein n=1 Tax=Sinomicrobium sp. N-1-3-6 TaxID=2219864 RepID=UPI000DCE611C|nr:glycoside hydrolase family 88 protein [Sinomicrobium sp. N-1-3-6]RAV28204.1 glucuronyl hydrolase [Sinomicrobium sp. N-1-3-6]